MCLSAWVVREVGKSAVVLCAMGLWVSVRHCAELGEMSEMSCTGTEELLVDVICSADAVWSWGDVSVSAFVSVSDEWGHCSGHGGGPHDVSSVSPFGALAGSVCEVLSAFSSGVSGASELYDCVADTAASDVCTTCRCQSWNCTCGECYLCRLCLSVVPEF